MVEVDARATGLASYNAGDWSAAAAALAVVDACPPEANEALAKSRWWLDDPKGARSLPSSSHRPTRLRSYSLH